MFFYFIESIVQDFEDEFIAFFAILAHEGIEVFHCGCFQWLETIELKYGANGVEDVGSFANDFRAKIPGALW